MSSWQGGPSWGPGDNGTPDWAALAEQSAARARRKRWLMIGGGVLATALVGAIVATAVVTTGGGKGDPGNNASKLPAPADLPEDTSAPAPSFSSVAPPPPPDPKEYISSADKDRAPITVDGFFPGEKLAMGDRVHIKGATGSTTDCATGTQGALGAVLNNNGCEQLIRATYRKEGVAVTVGIAVFDTEAQAKKTVDQASGGLASLSGAGVPTPRRRRRRRSTRPRAASPPSAARASRRSAAAVRSAAAPPTPTAATPTSPSAASPTAPESPPRTRTSSRSATT